VRGNPILGPGPRAGASPNDAPTDDATDFRPGPAPTPPFLGILVLDTAFPRIPGDVGNAVSHDVPVRFHVVKGADVPRILCGGPPDPALVAAFVAGARALEAAGAGGIVTSCGFLGHVQAELAAAVRIPVLASALSLGPLIRMMTGGRPLGILTADSRALTPALLRACGVDPATVRIAGLEGEGAWQRLILAPKEAQATTLDPGEIGALVERAARTLVAADPDIGAILLECTNLPPYAGRIREATGLPVFHVLHAAALMKLHDFAAIDDIP